MVSVDPLALSCVVVPVGSSTLPCLDGTGACVTCVICFIISVPNEPLFIDVAPVSISCFTKSLALVSGFAASISSTFVFAIPITSGTLSDNPGIIFDIVLIIDFILFSILSISIVPERINKNKSLIIFTIIFALEIYGEKNIPTYRCPIIKINISNHIKIHNIIFKNK